MVVWASREQLKPSQGDFHCQTSFTLERIDHGPGPSDICMLD